MSKEQEFIDIWRNRDIYVSDVPGFKKFNLLQGPSTDEYTLFASLSIWESAEVFSDWTQSGAFRKAHAGAGGAKGIYLGRPQFEDFETVV